MKNNIDDSVNLCSPSPDVDGVSDSPYTSSNLRADGQPEVDLSLPSIDDISPHMIVSTLTTTYLYVCPHSLTLMLSPILGMHVAYADHFFRSFSQINIILTILLLTPLQIIFPGFQVRPSNHTHYIIM